jgi:hypothetical protein
MADMSTEGLLMVVVSRVVMVDVLLAETQVTLMINVVIEADALLDPVG